MASELITRVDGVKRIREMMINGKWERGVSPDKLAPEWGLARCTVQDWALEAGRQLKSAQTPEELVEELVARLDRIAHSAEDRERYDAAIKAVRTILEARGMLQQQHRVEVVSKQVSEMSMSAKVAALLAHPELGPMIENEVLRRRGLLTEGTGE